jgi:fibronectin-binding autotransporter adhesin
MAILVALAAPSAAEAEDLHYTSATNVAFTIIGAWNAGASGGSPNAGDRAIFDQAGTGSSFLVGTRDVGQLVFQGAYAGAGIVSPPSVGLTGLFRIGGIDGVGIVSKVNREITISDRVALTGSQEWRLDSESGSLRQLSNMAAGSRTLTLGANTLTLNPVQAGNSFYLNNPISGTGGIAVTGAGKVYLGPTNSYSGGTFLYGGQLSVSSDAQLGAAAGGINFDGGELEITGTGFTATARTISFGANGGALDIVDAAATFTLGQALTGTGSLAKRGDGTLVVTGANSYSGVTTIEAGTLRVGDGGISGSLAGDVVNNARLVLDRAGTLALTGAISGSGSVQQLGPGTTILTGANSHTGGTTIAAGTLQIGDGGSSGSLAGDVVNNASLTFNRAGTLVLSGAISGSGSVQQLGSGTTVLAGQNSYAGGTTITAGTLQLGNGGNSGSLVGDVVNNGALAFNRADAVSFGGVISGTGSVRQLGAGTTVLTGANSYAGGTTITAGTLQLGNGGTSGSIVGAVVNNGRLAFNRADAVSFDGGISGTGSVQQLGSGTTTLTGANSYAGGTVIAAGTLQLGNGGTSGSLVGDVANNGRLVFNRAGTLALAGAISGSGSVQQLGSGTTVLTGANSYAGGTTIAAGTLQLGNGGTSGSIVGDVVNNGALTFNRSDALNFDGRISGTGRIDQIGSGITRLSADSSTFSGATTVQAGTLSVNGVLGGTMSVQGGRLQGIGMVGGTLNGAGGTIAPGNSIGTLTVNGDYRSSGGRLEIEAALGGDASPSDRLVVTGGTAGATLVTVLNQGGNGAPTVDGIKVVDVGGASDGSFTLANGDYRFQGQAALIAGAYAYTLQKNGVSTPGDGDWYLRSSFVPSDTAGNPVAGAAPRPLYQPGVPLYEAYGQVLQSLNGLPTLRQRIGGRLNGEGETGAGTPESRAVWARIEGAHSRITPRLSTSGTTYEIDSWRMQAGVEGQLLATAAGTLIGGVNAHHGTARADISSFFGRGKIETSGSGFGGTLSWYGQGGFYADAQAQTSWFDSDLSSTTAGRRLADGKGGFGYALGLELGQRIALGEAWSLTPQAQLIYGRVNADSFVDAFGARVALQDGDSLRGRLGLSTDYRRSWRDGAGQLVGVALYGLADLSYEFLDGTTARVSGTPFTSAGERLWGGLGLGARYDWGRYALYGELKARTSLANFADSHEVSGRAGFRVSW